MTTIPFDLDQREEAKMLPDKRRFILKAKGDAKTVEGGIDKRLFTGDINLYAIKDSIKGTWFLKYDRASIPQGLDQQFTEYSKLEEFVRAYFNRRNVEVL